MSQIPSAIPAPPPDVTPDKPAGSTSSVAPQPTQTPVKTAAVPPPPPDVTPDKTWSQKYDEDVAKLQPAIEKKTWEQLYPHGRPPLTAQDQQDVQVGAPIGPPTAYPMGTSGYVRVTDASGRSHIETMNNQSPAMRSPDQHSVAVSNLGTPDAYAMTHVAGSDPNNSYSEGMSKENFAQFGVQPGESVYQYTDQKTGKVRYFVRNRISGSERDLDAKSPATVNAVARANDYLDLFSKEKASYGPSKETADAMVNAQNSLAAAKNLKPAQRDEIFRLGLLQKKEADPEVQKVHAQIHADIITANDESKPDADRIAAAQRAYVATRSLSGIYRSYISTGLASRGNGAEKLIPGEAEANAEYIKSRGDSAFGGNGALGEGFDKFAAGVNRFVAGAAGASAEGTNKDLNIVLNPLAGPDEGKRYVGSPDLEEMNRALAQKYSLTTGLGGGLGKMARPSTAALLATTAPLGMPGVFAFGVGETIRDTLEETGKFPTTGAMVKSGIVNVAAVGAGKLIGMGVGKTLSALASEVPAAKQLATVLPAKFLESLKVVAEGSYTGLGMGLINATDALAHGQPVTMESFTRDYLYGNLLHGVFSGADAIKRIHEAGPELTFDEKAFTAKWDAAKTDAEKRAVIDAAVGQMDLTGKFKPMRDEAGALTDAGKKARNTVGPMNPEPAGPEAPRTAGPGPYLSNREAGARSGVNIQPATDVPAQQLSAQDVASTDPVGEAAKRAVEANKKPEPFGGPSTEGQKRDHYNAALDLAAKHPQLSAEEIKAAAQKVVDATKPKETNDVKPTEPVAGEVGPDNSKGPAGKPEEPKPEETPGAGAGGQEPSGDVIQKRIQENTDALKKIRDGLNSLPDGDPRRKVLLDRAQTLLGALGRDGMPATPETEVLRKQIEEAKYPESSNKTRQNQEGDYTGEENLPSEQGDLTNKPEIPAPPKDVNVEKPAKEPKGKWSDKRPDGKPNAVYDADFRPNMTPILYMIHANTPGKGYGYDAFRDFLGKVGNGKHFFATEQTDAGAKMFQRAVKEGLIKQTSGPQGLTRETTWLVKTALSTDAGRLGEDNAKEPQAPKEKSAAVPAGGVQSNKGESNASNEKPGGVRDSEQQRKPGGAAQAAPGGPEAGNAGGGPERPSPREQRQRDDIESTGCEVVGKDKDGNLLVKNKQGVIHTVLHEDFDVADHERGAHLESIFVEHGGRKYSDGTPETFRLNGKDVPVPRNQHELDMLGDGAEEALRQQIKPSSKYDPDTKHVVIGPATEGSSERTRRETYAHELLHSEIDDMDMTPQERTALKLYGEENAINRTLEGRMIANRDVAAIMDRATLGGDKEAVAAGDGKSRFSTKADEPRKSAPTDDVTFGGKRRKDASERKNRTPEELEERIAKDHAIKVYPDPTKTVGGKPWTSIDKSHTGPGSLLISHYGEAVADAKIKQAGLDAVKESGLDAETAAKIKWPTAKEIDKALAQSDGARYWYELSGHAFTERDFALSKPMTEKMIDTTAATSGGEKPRRNVMNAIAVMAQEEQGVPVTVGMRATPPSTRALGGEDRGTQKFGNFANTMKLTAGLHDGNPLPTIDLQMMDSYGLQGSPSPVLYEALARHVIKLRDMINETLPEGEQKYESWQVQALMWVANRDSSAAPDDYAAVLPGVIKMLKDGGVPLEDGKIGMSTLKDPRTQEILSPTSVSVPNTHTATVESRTKLTVASQRQTSLLDSIKTVNEPWAKRAVGEFDTIQRRTFRALGETRAQDDPNVKGGKRSILSNLVASAMDLTTKSHYTSRVDTRGLGTFEGEASPNMRIPLASSASGGEDRDEARQVTDQASRKVVLAALGKYLKQDAVPASQFLRVPEGQHNTYSILLRRYDGADMPKEDLLKLQKAIGRELSYSKVVNGWQVDINVGGAEPMTDRAAVEKAVEGTFGGDKLIRDAILLPRLHDSDYIMRQDYGKILKEFENGLQKNIDSSTGAARRRAEQRLSDWNATVEALDGVRRDQEKEFAKWERDTRRVAAKSGAKQPSSPDAVVPPTEPSVEMSSKSDDKKENAPQDHKMSGDGRGFTKFFEEASKGNRAPDATIPYKPAINIGDLKSFTDEYVKHRGNFDDHIATSIPAFREVQQAVGDAIVKTYGKGGAHVLDVGASEGAFNKAITAQSDGRIKTLALDPNQVMAKHFAEHSNVPGADYDMSAFGSREDEGKEAWTEDNGVKINNFTPREKYDVVHEAMVFQFISNTRSAQFARMKEVMKPDGVAIIEEKVKEDTPQWHANEAKKDAYKAQYYTEAQRAAKKAEVLEKGAAGAKEAESQREQKVTGMNDLMVTPSGLEEALKSNWKYVAQHWDSGNFKGYVASDSREALDKLLGNLHDLNSEYSTIKTPTDISRPPETSKFSTKSDKKNERLLKDTTGTRVSDPDDIPATKHGWWIKPDRRVVSIDSHDAHSLYNWGLTQKEAMQGGAIRMMDLATEGRQVVNPALDIQGFPNGLLAQRSTIDHFIARQIDRGRTTFVDDGKAHHEVNDERDQKAMWAKIEGKAPASKFSTKADDKKENAPTFFSQAAKMVDAKMGGKGDPAQVRSMLLNNGVKPDEMKWSGLDDFLTNHKGSVTKDEVQNFLRENNVQIKEVTKGENPQDLKGKYATIGERLDALARNSPTKFQSYQLPGGKNYREFLMTLPPDQYRSDLVDQHNTAFRAEQALASKMVEKYGRGWYNDAAHKLDSADWTAYRRVQSSATDARNAMEASAKTQGEFRSRHWDEPNVLAHVRMNDRAAGGPFEVNVKSPPFTGRGSTKMFDTAEEAQKFADFKNGQNGAFKATVTPKGKTLHLEEIQSDWHQAGREKGYKNPERWEELNNKFRTGKATPEDAEELNRLQPAQAAGVPAAPFSKNWHELALRRMLRMAAEGGYDRLSWTPGDLQAERYDLSKQVQGVEYLEPKPGMRSGYIIAHDLQGRKVLEKDIDDPKELESYIGKDAAKKLVEATPSIQNGVRYIEGEDLKVGGEGMKGFYDKIVPDYLNKYGKKWGAKVGETKIEGAPQTGYDPIGERMGKKPPTGPELTVPSIEITPAMKKSVLEEGQPLFSTISDKRPRGEAPDDAKKFPTGIQQTSTNEERAQRHLDPLEKSYRGQEGVLREARAKEASSPGWAAGVVNDMVANPKARTDRDFAAVMVHKVEQSKAFNAAYARGKAAQKAGETEGVEEAQRQMQASQERLDLIAQALVSKTGSASETGRGLAFLNQLRKEDYSPAGVAMRAHAANNFEKLPEKVQAKLDDLLAKHAESQKKLEKLQADNEELQRQVALKNTVNTIRAGSIGGIIRTRNAPAMRAAGIDMLKAIVGGKAKFSTASDTSAKFSTEADDTDLHEQDQGLAADYANTPGVQKALEAIARSHILAGVHDSEKVLEATHNDVKDILPGITPSEVSDILTGRGKYRQLSKDELDTEYRQIKAELRISENLKGVTERNEAPPKTGFEQQALTDKARRMEQQLYEEMKKRGITTTDPETARKGALDSAKTYYDNRIKDLRAQIAAKEQTVKIKTDPPTDDALKALKKEYEGVQKDYREMFGDPKMSDEKRIEMAIKSADRMTAEYERQVKEHELISPKASETTETPELKAARARRDAAKAQRDAMREAANPKASPEEVAVRRYISSRLNRAAEIATKFVTQDFGPKEKPAALTQTPEMRAADIEKKRWQNALDQKIESIRLSNRPLPQKIADKVVEVARTSLLTAPSVVEKLTGAAAARVAIEPFESAVGAGLGKLPILSRVAAKSARHGSISFTAEAKAITDGLIRKGAPEMWKKLSTGHSDIDVLYGSKADNKEPPTILNVFGRIHGTLKEPVRQAEWARSFQMRVEHGMRNGEKVKGEATLLRYGIEAYADAQRSIFMQDNFVTKGLNALYGSMERSKTAPALGKGVAALGRIAMPIVKVPTNIVGETLQYGTGAAVEGPLRLARALHNGLDTLDGQEADNIMRAFKKGTVGLGLITLGYLAHAAVGGLHQPGKRKDEKDVPEGAVRIFGVDIPKSLMHNPALQAIQIGATISDLTTSKANRKDTEERGKTAAAWQVALGLIAETPVLKEAADVSGALDPRKTGSTLARLVGSRASPGIISQPTAYFDKNEQGKPVQRAPETTGEFAKAGYPILRQQVPQKLERDISKMDPVTAATAYERATADVQQAHLPEVQHKILSSRSDDVLNAEDAIKAKKSKGVMPSEEDYKARADAIEADHARHASLFAKHGVPLPEDLPLLREHERLGELEKQDKDVAEVAAKAKVRMAEIAAGTVKPEPGEYRHLMEAARGGDGADKKLTGDDADTYKTLSLYQKIKSDTKDAPKLREALDGFVQGKIKYEDLPDWFADQPARLEDLPALLQGLKASKELVETH